MSAKNHPGPGLKRWYSWLKPRTPSRKKPGKSSREPVINDQILENQGQEKQSEISAHNHSNSQKRHSWGSKPWTPGNKRPGKLSNSKTSQEGGISAAGQEKGREISDNSRDFPKTYSKWSRARTQESKQSGNSQWVRPRTLGQKQPADRENQSYGPKIGQTPAQISDLVRDDRIELNNEIELKNEHVNDQNPIKESIQVLEEIYLEKDNLVTAEHRWAESEAEALGMSEAGDVEINEAEAVQAPEYIQQQKAVDNSMLKENEELFMEAVTLYRQGIAGDKECVVKAYELLKKAYEAAPENHLVEAYYGSAISLLGRDAVDPGERFKFALKGLKILDKLVALEPDNLEIRSLRAFQCSKLPEMYFHRTGTAIEDFSYLVSRYEQNNSLLPQAFYSQILFELGSAYLRLGRKKEAESAWLRLKSVTDDPKYEALIKQEGLLDSNSEKPKWQKKLEERLEAQQDWLRGKDDEKMKEAISLYNQALAGDKPALEKAFEFFEKVYKRRPQDPLIQAYYADCLSLMGESTSDTSKMFRNVLSAMRHFDQAVNASPDNITIRLLRGYNSYRLPEAFFRRTLTTVSDFEYIVQEYEKDPSRLSQETYWQILYDLGDAYERLDMKEEAKAAWSKLAQSGDPNFQSLAQERMDEGLIDNSSAYEAFSNPDEVVQEGIKLYELAVAGNKKAALTAKELLQKAYQADPLNALAEGYYGSSIAVAGRYSLDPREIFSSYFKGLQHVKNAVARNSKDYRLHLLLAQFYKDAPNFVSATDRAIKEFKFLKAGYERDNTIFPEERYWQILYDLGDCYQRVGETEQAQKVWYRLLKKTSDPKYAELLETDKERENNMAKDKDKENLKEKYMEMAMKIAKEKTADKEKNKERKRDKEKAKTKEKSRTKERSRTNDKSREKRRSRDKEKK